MSRARLEALVRSVAQTAAGRRLDAALQHTLEGAFPADGKTFASVTALCREGVAEAGCATASAAASASDASSSRARTVTGSRSMWCR